MSTQRWSTVRRSGGQLFGDHTLGLKAKKVNFSAIKWSTFRLTKTNDVPDPSNSDPDIYRLRLPCEVLTYELTGITTADAGDGHYFAVTKLSGLKLSDYYPADSETPVEVELIAYHQLLDRAKPRKRLVEHTRALFFKDTLDGPLPLGDLNARALHYESYTLALTTELLTTIFGDKLTPDVSAALADKRASGYLSGDLAARFGDNTTGQYWICSGMAGFNADAAQHFYLPERYTDPFGNLTLLDYDPRDLYIRSSTDALGNRSEVKVFDCRVLAPSQLQDINGNLSEVRFDVLGMPTVMAVSGKNGEGDTLGGFDDATLNPELATLIGFFVTDEYSPAQAKRFLGNATARYLYSFGETEEQLADGTTVIHWGQHPACACGIVREQHAAQQPDSPVQSGFEYSDGSGNVLAKKVQAEAKLPNGPLRWIASGKTILNNKGKPVKQYEPYFSAPSAGHRYEEPQEIGVTPIIYYDAAGRVIRTESPDGSFSRVEFSPWHVKSFDANDTVLESRWYRERLTAAERGVPLYEPGATAVVIAEAQAAEAIATTALTPKKRAARLARDHANTPTEIILDSLGREVIAIAHNRTNRVNEKYVTFSKLDAEGKPLWVQDARRNRVMQYVTPPLPAGVHPFNDPQNLTPHDVAPCYDIAGNLLFQHSMDAGERWMLNDAAGKPLFAWNSRGFRSRVEYDALHRPTGLFISVAGKTTLAGTPRNDALPPEPEVLVEKRVYGENHPDASANLRGKPYRVYDSAGVATSARYDFKGNLLTSNRRFARDYTTVPNWTALASLANLSQITAAAEPLLEVTPPLITQTTYDALNRPTTVTTPDGSVYQPGFNDANLLERVDVRLPGAATAKSFVTNIDYDAKGQRILIAYGNGATTGYEYDPFTFRLIGLQTTRPANPDATASLLFKNPTVVQDLRYTYDPAGNITRIEDAALRTRPQAGAACDYAYDALYRLTAASGREHSGQTDFALSPADSSRRDYPFVGQRIHPNDLQGLGGYVERYTYDAVGNIMQLVHYAGSDLDQPGQTRWQRHYQYALDSNRLLATSLPGDPDNLPDYVAAGGYSARYNYDAHGNMASMPHLPLMRWDFRDQLSASSQQVVNDGTPETTYYVYDAAGQRARKVTERQAGAGQTPTRKNERLYLGGYEVYREYSGGAAALERQTLHIMDDSRSRIALVETITAPAAAPRVRYQLGNHLSSASVELDGDGALIGYEEYHPYGTSAFQAGRSAAEVSLKRYRYTGKERDEETGFSYHGTRYYAGWLGRWASCDPASLIDGINLYRYVSDNPVGLIDPNGMYGLKDFNKDLGRVNWALGIITGPIQGPIPAIVSAVTSKATEAITGKSAPKEGEPGEALSGLQRVEAGTDAVIAATPVGSLHAASKAAGRAIGDALVGKTSKVEAIKRGDPTGIAAKESFA